jgi:hypothetical protein
MSASAAWSAGKLRVTIASAIILQPQTLPILDTGTERLRRLMLKA